MRVPDFYSVPENPIPNIVDTATALVDTVVDILRFKPSLCLNLQETTNCLSVILVNLFQIREVVVSFPTFEVK